MIKIRPITVSDASAFNKLYKQIEAESPYMLYEKEERQTSDETQMNFISKILSSNTSMIFLAELEDSLIPVGFIAILSENLKKKAHMCSIVMGLLKNFQHKGLGSSLMTMAPNHAKNFDATRVELSVIKENDSAIALYKKFGFEIEGVKKHSIKQNGQYLDELLMAKIL